jgi:hypothetical protein
MGSLVRPFEHLAGNRWHNYTRDSFGSLRKAYSEDMANKGNG